MKTEIAYPFTLANEDEASEFVARFGGLFYNLHTIQFGYPPDDETADTIGDTFRLAMAGEVPDTLRDLALRRCKN